jgi:hypothetical protein
MHGFFVAHHGGSGSLAGTEEGWSSRLTNGQVEQRHTLCLGLGAFRSDLLKNIRTLLSQSRLSHGRRSPFRLTAQISLFFISSPYSAN